MNGHEYTQLLQGIMGSAETLITIIERDVAAQGEQPKSQPVVKVEAWGVEPIPAKLWDIAGHGEKIPGGLYRCEYTITGQPDWLDIIAKTLGQGNVDVVRVTAIRGKFIDHKYCSDTCVTFAQPPYDHTECPGLGMIETLEFPSVVHSWSKPSDAEIEAAIRAHYAEEKAPEPDWKTAALKSLREKWLPIVRGEISDDDVKCAMCAEYDKFNKKFCCPLTRKRKKDCGNHYIPDCVPYRDYAAEPSPDNAIAVARRLAEIAEVELTEDACYIKGEEPKKEPEYKAGDWITPRNEAGKPFQLESLDFITESELHRLYRPATSADFERTVQGEKVRVSQVHTPSYKARSTQIDTDTTTMHVYDDYGVGKVILKALADVVCDDGSVGVPVIPLSVTGGLMLTIVRKQ